MVEICPSCESDLVDGKCIICSTDKKAKSTCAQ